MLGFAYNEGVKKAKAEENMIFVGLQGMIDPPRKEAKEAIKKAKEAGIRVIMITGDHLTTAKAIAKELGITGKAIEGKDIEKINLKEKIDEISIYARVNPEHKLKIVEALQKKGHIVAMTGDGVNDAPALKKADIGIAMGITGTDVSKEAAKMILLDDNFKSIVAAIEEGRNIYDNIKKFVNYLLSSNMGEVLVLFIAMIIGFRTSEGAVALPLTALQILWVNLLTDGLPALTLAVDPPDKKVMKKPPRNPKEQIITKNMTWNIIIIGIIITLAVIGIFSYKLPEGLAKAQTMALTTLIILEFARLELIRKQYNTGFFSNKYLLAALATIMALQVTITYWEPARNIFGLTPLSIEEWLIMIIIGIGAMIIGKTANKIIIKKTGQKD